MKIFITLLACSYALIAEAQNPKIQNNIKDLKTLNVYGNGKIIIGKIVVNQTLTTKIFLLKSYQEIDSSGIYTTTFSFGNNENIPLFGVDLSFQFDKPVISVTPEMSVAMSVRTEITNDKTAYWLKAGQINRPNNNGNVLLSIILKSKEKVTTIIGGSDGFLK